MRAFRETPLGFFAVQLPDGTRFWAVGEVRHLEVEHTWDEFSSENPQGRHYYGADLAVKLHNVRWHMGEPPRDTSLEDMARLPAMPDAALPPILRQLGAGKR